MTIRIIEVYILESLALFQYLTSTQLLWILPIKSIASVNRYLRGLKTGSRPLIKMLEFGFAPGKWPLPPVYYLSDRWAKYLVNQLNYNPQGIRRPRWRSSFFASDYYHRIATINFKIAFIKRLSKKWYRLNFYHSYFDREGGNNSHSGITSKSLAALQAWGSQIIPDAIAGYTTEKRSHLIAFEQHMGKDAKRALKQIKQHCWALSVWAANKKYGSKRSCRIYYVFEHESCMNSVKKTAANSVQLIAFREYFRFTTTKRISSGYENIWDHIE